MLSCTLPWTRGSSSETSDTCPNNSDNFPNSAYYEDERNDSAFCEPEYSNPASFESTEAEYQNSLVARRLLQLNISEKDTFENEDDLIPDYEEVAQEDLQKLRQSLRKSCNTIWTNKSHLFFKNTENKESDATKERIMQSLIYCIHKVSFEKHLKS